jgi:hypothetical protein
MRALLGLLLLMSVQEAVAADQRWTTGFGQGTVEAIIRNASGSDVNIYCPAGQTDTTPGMFIQLKRVRPRAKEQVDVRIVVDGRKHTFRLDEIQFLASGRASMNSLSALIDALATSRSRKFSVEFPKFRMTEQFSLLGAKAALKSGRSFLTGCDK